MFVCLMYISYTIICIFVYLMVKRMNIWWWFIYYYIWCIYTQNYRWIKNSKDIPAKHYNCIIIIHIRSLTPTDEGVSFDPCSQVYLGPAPFSEKETQNIRDAVLAEGGRIKIYLSWHSYSQLLLVPWGYTTDLPTDYQELVSRHCIIFVLVLFSSLSFNWYTLI